MGIATILEIFRSAKLSPDDPATRHAYVQDLVRRMALKENVKNSDDSISWHAFREAEKVTNPEVLGDLEAIADASKSKEERSAAYFILGTVGKNSGDVRFARSLMRYAIHEQNKYLLSTLLASVEKVHKPIDVPLEPIFICLNDERWLVRHAAIRALKNSDSPAAEEKLLALLESTDDPYDKIYCHSTLNQIGTPRSIPVISQNLTSRKRDVKASAHAAIVSIKARHTLP
jgi:HEAT repeat protein